MHAAARIAKNTITLYYKQIFNTITRFCVHVSYMFHLQEQRAIPLSHNSTGILSDKSGRIVSRGSEMRGLFFLPL